MKLRAKDLHAVESYCSPIKYASDPEVTKARCERWLAENNVRVVWKSAGRMSTSLKRLLVLDRESWANRDSIGQAGLLAHETAHCTRGFSRLAYLFSARRRWIEETIAFHEQAKAVRAAGTRLKDIFVWARHVTQEVYPSDYLIFDEDAQAEAFYLITRGIQ